MIDRRQAGSGLIRRGGRDGVAPGGASVPVPLDPTLGTLHTWARGDNPENDINTTPDPDQYAHLANAGAAGGTFAQATSGDQPQVSSVFTLPSPAFSGGRRLVSTLDAGEYAALHNGSSSVTLTAVVRRNLNSVIETFFSTSVQAASSSRGISMRGHTSGRLQLLISNGSAQVYSQISSTNVFGATTRYVVQLVKSSTTVTVYVNGTQAITGTISSPSASEPAHALTLGSDRTDASLNPFGGNIAEWTMHLAAHDTDQRALMRSYLESRWVTA